VKKEEEIVLEFSQTLDIKPLLKDISNIGGKKFVIYFLSYKYVTNQQYFLLQGVDIWKNFSYGDWKDVFNRIQNNKVGIIGLAVFMYKYLKIDSVKIINIADNVADKNKQEVNATFYERRGLFAFDRGDESILKRYNLDFGDITERLLKEGAPPATSIEPKYIKLD
jgi:hypothetical protein